MKIRVTLKDPDALRRAVEEAVQADTTRIDGISEAERIAISRERASAVEGAIAEKWMPYGEYLIVEFDTDDGTAIVLPGSALQ